MIPDHLERTYNELVHSPYPVFIWGAGSMSVEVKSRLIEKGIFPAGNFITAEAGSNPHIVSSTEPVFSLEELEQRYDRINVVAGHGHYEKLNDLRPYSFINKIYVIPNPYLQYKGPDLNYVYQNQDKLRYIIERLADAESQQALERYLAVSITNDISYLLDSNICVGGMFGFKELRFTDSETFIDAGAWEGDTIDSFLKATGERYEKIYAVEPDPMIFRTLKNRYGDKENVMLCQCGLGETDGELFIARQNTQSAFLTTSSSDPASEKIAIKALDSLLAEENISLLKISVPFMFFQILKGGATLIKRNRPRLIIHVSCADSFLLYDVIKWITDLNLSYKLALRFDFPMPTRLFLYAYPV